MTLISISARPLDIAFKTSFKHASASREATQSLWVTARSTDGTTGHGEGCPREYVTGETLEGALAFVVGHERAWINAIADADSLARWVADNTAEIDAHPAAWAAVELALLDLLGKRAEKSVESLLGLPPIAGQFRYTAVIGDGSAHRFGAELDRYLRAGFKDFKIKLSGDAQRDRDKVAALQAAGVPPAAVRADANNLWRDAQVAIEFLSALDFAFMGIEEPLRAGDLAGLARIGAALSTALILDESLLRVGQLDTLPEAPARWIVNLRISKMGGLLRSLALAERLRHVGLSLIVGAHVGETSLLTRAALSVANAFRDILVAQEGAFGTHLLEQDVVDPPLMFGAGGLLDGDAVSRSPGWGLDCHVSRDEAGAIQAP